jgi:hypothetical protein
MFRTLARSVALAAGVVAFAACSDPISPVATPDDLAGPAMDHIGSQTLQTTLFSTGTNTTFCGYVDAMNGVGSASTCDVGDGTTQDITNDNLGWKTLIPGADWISYIATGDDYKNETGTYTYQRSFSINAGLTNGEIDVALGADNNAIVQLDGATICTTGADSHVNVAPFECNATGIAPGSHTVTFIVTNTRVVETSPGICDVTPAAYAFPEYDRADCDNPTALKYSIAVWASPAVIVGDRGCSPGYWKNHGYPQIVSTPPGSIIGPNSLFGSVGFDTFGGMTFDAVLNAGGGGAVALGRHAASAYLNSVVFGPAYGMTPAQVVAEFNAATGDAALENALAAKFAGMEDVNGRTCNAGLPNTNGGGKK